jgi:hypothetical protein
MENIALLTSLFDYPENYSPSFYKNAVKYFNPKDIHIIRNSGLITDGSYYDKLYFYKVVKVLEYIEEHIEGKYEYILFLDATDTNFISPPNNLITKFEDLTCSIIMGAEKGLWPPTNYVHMYDEKPILTDYKYLNSGTYFGYTNKIIHHLKQIIENEYQTGIDDQGKWTIEYLLSDDIVIDQKQDFFFSTFNSKDKIKFNEKKITLINSSSCIVHDNGGFTEETIKLTELLNENN